jgi:hypothetical protein
MIIHIFFYIFTFMCVCVCGAYVFQSNADGSV